MLKFSKIFFLGLSFFIFEANALMFHKNFQAKTNHKSNFARPDATMNIMEQLKFKQKLVHSDPSDSSTFDQRYFVDSSYAEGPTSPVFYIVCGEGNCRGTGSYSFIQTLAKENKAHLIALEHRFYGESMPFEILTPENMSTLNLATAIEDMASFQRWITKERGLTGKWIVVGGSYAGTLSAFYRLKHPELAAGSLASSAPIFIKPEFSEYDAHVAEVINKIPGCGEKVREAVKLIEEKVATPIGTTEMKTLFRATEIRVTEDFLYVVADMLAAAVQYGTHTTFCENLLSSKDIIQGYASAGLATINAMGETPLSISLQVAEKMSALPYENLRQWMWQSCNEFGWFQVANGTGSETSRSSRIDLAYHDRVCERLYGESRHADESLNDIWYSALIEPTTSHIIFTNGSNDPWERLSITPGSEMAANLGLDVLLIDGSSHCSDLRSFVVLPSLIVAQERIKSVVKEWLQ